MGNGKTERVKVVSLIDRHNVYGDHDAFALDVLAGLSETRKNIPSKYMYDDEGSRLFTKITELEEYYPTRCELENLERHRAAISRHIGPERFNLVEFGPGNGRKTRILIDYFLQQNLDFRYVPIDISAGAMDELTGDLQSSFPNLNLEGLVSDYFSGIKWLNNRYHARNVVLFLGSNIGNFGHGKARFFLRNLWNCLNNGDIVITGFDLKKDIELLIKAYNDSQGVTSAFNINLLKRINRDLGGQFVVEQFRHIGTYDVFSGAMESYLVSLQEQEVFIEEIGRSFRFGPWEPIHVEYSYKYLDTDIDQIAFETGYKVREHLYDSNRYFIDSVWEVKKQENNGDREC